MRKIYDYKDIRRLDESLIADELSKNTIITATSDLAAAMKRYYKYQVQDIHKLLTLLISEWEENVKDVKNYVKLRNVISNYILDNNLDDTKVATYLQRNAFDIWNAIKLLVEADVYPSDIADSDSVPVNKFKDIWNEFEKQTDAIMLFRSTFSYELSDAKKVEKRIMDGLKETSNNPISKDIYLVGFYFITPIQERILDVLENAGHNLHFLNCHDLRYKFLVQVWEKTFPAEYQLGKTIDVQPEIELKNTFGEAINGNKEDIPIKMTKHYSDFEFAEMVKEAVDKGEQVYSPNAKAGEAVMMEFYPEFYEKKHLLSYPVGQYIYYLHMMWSTLSNKLDMKYEYVKKCFASGWLIKDGLNGKQFQFEMRVLEPFFSKCHSEDDWNKMIDALIEAKDTISKFDEREHGDERWHQLLGNPFYNMSIYNIDISKIKEIVILIKKIIEDVSFLFPSGERTDLFEHFQRITGLIKQHIDKDEILKDEIVIAKDLIYQLSDKAAKGIECPMSGVRDAIVMLIGNHFDEYESQDEETADKKRMISPLAMVEAAMMSNYGQTIHIVLADEFNMPGATKKLPWPLTNDLLDSLKIEGREKTKKYVRAMRSVIDNRPLSYRYLFFSFMGNFNARNKPDISIEWICKKENKDIECSPYVRILSVPKEDEIIKQIDEGIFNLIKDNNVVSDLKPITLPKKSVPEIVEMDYFVCKQKYLYSYVLNRLPSYMSEFHYSFEMSKIISALALVGDCDLGLVSENVYNLFPFFRKIEKHQAADFASKKWSIPSPFMWNDIQYPGHLLLPHYLDRNVGIEAQNRYSMFIEKKDVSEEVKPEFCMYCQYSEICMEKHKEQIEAYE